MNTSSIEPPEEGTVDLFEGQSPMTAEEGGTEKLPEVKAVPRTLKTDLADLFQATFDAEFRELAKRVRERCDAAPDAPEHVAVLAVLDYLIAYRKAMVSSDVIRAEQIVNSIVARLAPDKLDAINTVLPFTIMRIQAQLRSRMMLRVRVALGEEEE